MWKFYTRLTVADQARKAGPRRPVLVVVTEHSSSSTRARQIFLSCHGPCLRLSHPPIPPLFSTLTLPRVYIYSCDFRLYCYDDCFVGPFALVFVLHIFNFNVKPRKPLVVPLKKTKCLVFHPALVFHPYGKVVPQGNVFFCKYNC